jgi:hypothetical protein
MAKKSGMPPSNLNRVMSGWRDSRFFRRTSRPAVKRESDALLSITALAYGSVGALFGLFVGYAVFGFPICISTTIVGGVFGASLGRYLG